MILKIVWRQLKNEDKTSYVNSLVEHLNMPRL